MTEVGAKTAIPLLRENITACPSLLNAAIEKTLSILEGSRLVTLRAAQFFNGLMDQLSNVDSLLSDRLPVEFGKGEKVIDQALHA